LTNNKEINWKIFDRVHDYLQKDEKYLKLGWIGRGRMAAEEMIKEERKERKICRINREKSKFGQINMILFV
jgi:hypothetical protein